LAAAFVSNAAAPACHLFIAQRKQHTCDVQQDDRQNQHDRCAGKNDSSGASSSWQ
jgi:hypothetical protein